MLQGRSVKVLLAAATCRTNSHQDARDSELLRHQGNRTRLGHLYRAPTLLSSIMRCFGTKLLSILTQAPSPDDIASDSRGLHQPTRRNDQTEERADHREKPAKRKVKLDRDGPQEGQQEEQQRQQDLFLSIPLENRAACGSKPGGEKGGCNLGVRATVVGYSLLSLLSLQPFLYLNPGGKNNFRTRVPLL